MTTQLLNTDDIYTEISEWWKSRKFPIVDRVLLPNSVFVTKEGDTLLAIVFIYHTETPMAWLAFPTSNPNTSFKEREGAINLLFKNVKDAVGPNKYVFTTSNTPRIVDALINNNFTEGDKEVTHFLKLIQ